MAFCQAAVSARSAPDLPRAGSGFLVRAEYAIMHSMIKYRHSLPLPTLVDTAEALQEMLSRLLAEPAVAVDTESNSLYAYNERVCLLQFSVPGEDYLVDPLAIGLAVNSGTGREEDSLWS